MFSLTVEKKHCSGEDEQFRLELFLVLPKKTESPIKGGGLSPAFSWFFPGRLFVSRCRYVSGVPASCAMRSLKGQNVLSNWPGTTDRLSRSTTG
jgi:hypothetical protein